MIENALGVKPGKRKRACCSIDGKGGAVQLPDGVHRRIAEYTAMTALVDL